MSVKIEGLEQVSAKLRTVSSFTAWASPPMDQSLALVHDNIAEYQPKSQGAFSRLATPAQRRAYWAKVKSGEARHGANGYVRSGTLGRKWTSKRQNTVDGIQGVVGNNAPYARYVQSFAQQQPFHKETGFQTDRGAIDDTADDIGRVWQHAIRVVLSK